MADTNPMEDTVILVKSYGMGSGDTDLQLKLFNTYLTLLEQTGSLPAAMCFYTDGVRLAVAGSPMLERLHRLEEKGVRLVLCSSCLSYYNLVEKVQVGLVGSMADILEAQNRAAKVITL
jgi:DsrE/DsrF-like family